MTKDLPSIETLRKLLRYEPDTGKLFWLFRENEMFKSGGYAKAWNARYAGKEALPQLSDQGYKVGTILKSRFKAHRICWAIYYGYHPTMQIDHINGIRSDNRISNLRDVSSGENARNAAKKSSNTSGITGVARTSCKKMWRADICKNGKLKYLGAYSCIAKAIHARKNAEVDLGYTSRHGK